MAARMKGERSFKTEAEMCASFSESARRRGWTVYPEIHDFDIVLAADGIQVGIEAKLRGSLGLLAQIARKTVSPSTRGPAWLAVVVGECSHDARAVADALGVVTIVHSSYSGWHFDGPEQWKWSLEYQERHLVKPLELPGVPLDGPAGEPAPFRDTPWKRKAMQLLAILLESGVATTADFRSLGIDNRIWLQRGWIKATQTRGVFAIGEPPRYDLQHPAAWAAMLVARKPEPQGTISETRQE